MALEKIKESAPVRNFTINFGPQHFNSFLFQAVYAVKPPFILKKIRKSGQSLLVPAYISDYKQYCIGLKWIVECAKKRKKKTGASFMNCLLLELNDSSLMEGMSWQKKIELRKIALSNRIFLRYRWW